MPHEVLLTGLDAANPLGFLASLGVLEIVHEQSGGDARLGFREEGLWRPVLTGVDSIEAIASMAIADLESWKDHPALKLRYKKGSGKVAHDLKPSPSTYRKYLEDLLNSDDPRSARAVDFAGAYGVETVTANTGDLKPTALHFTAGQQEFLAMVQQLVEGVNEDDLVEALRGPWTYSRPLPVLQWDSSAARFYALRASDPSKEKKLGVPGADWLAFCGLALLPVAPDSGRLVTTGCGGGWKTGHFTWPLWTVPIESATVRSVVGLRETEKLSPAERRARGIGAVFRSRIHRTDQGGYGSFAPAQLL